MSLIDSIRTRRNKSSDGFTLIELMVVVLIIALLLAIAIPTFLGAQTKAKDRLAQSSLRNMLTTAKTVYPDGNTYLGVTIPGIAMIEKSAALVDDTTNGNATGKKISFQSTAQTIILTAMSASGDCFALKDDALGVGTRFAKIAAASNGGSCKASDTFTFTASGWG
jgi:type IV pilus assembly protein PilA